MTIRGFVPADADDLYDVCLRTGDDGADASDLFRDPRLLGSIYVGPYLALEPELAFVLAADVGPVGGYVLGARDTATFEDACERLWWPALRARYPRGSGGAESMDAEVIDQLHEPRTMDPTVLQQYPSHLHIDLLPQWQGAGWGRRLLTRLLTALTAAGSPGVHLGVSPTNQRAIAFYRRSGFVQLPVPGDGVTMGKALGTPGDQTGHAQPSPDVGPPS